MREILFRGKRTDNGAWETGSLVVIRGGTSEERIYIAEKMTGYHTPVISETVGQYTGLTDKNGKRIFEGDIVHGNLPDLSYEPDRIGVVKWGLFGWIVGFNVPEWKMPRIGFGSFGDIEVIGNIHDNPELLEGINEA